MELIFATNNRHKIEEIRPLLPIDIQLKTLEEAGIGQDIPEPHPSLEENAREKSGVIHRLTGRNCFSEDTGLEVTALKGAPGVKTARFAGPDASAEENIRLLLEKLGQEKDRSARFRTVISLILDGKEYQFEGICEGRISEHPSGNRGFGYDPVFIPEGASRCFADMSLEEKQVYSHRRKATDQLVDFLVEQATKL
ncbi:RdgB/HAM1 family non-canonical purine NTP pyrophosphatase [Flavihumibacter sp. CACIAM 22H1]|uniref:RdgB/HAM1 family non-canonical purine NTP pyrophosphatase n=1 Tax=Flavihumibacter sp. CACIAM 22H1 TaxID=1812911 RepID=UPI0007A8FC1A|nr:RdgB/HAM1 family non-canonical purine NTP pyrophosphatase [Flavihumibacter sp. CACIAM 22H1]KYP16072.1 MAG: non-canonical purine NTP pyrophosphatase [Flavihumibacter sp. CACIAM 22H1]